MSAAAIRRELLTGNKEDLQRRRKVLALSALGIIDFAFISLYQSGIIKKLPDLPFKIFDSNRVNASNDAYSLRAPDGTITSLVYAATMIAATWKGTENSGRKPMHDVALASVIAANAAGAVYYLGNMIFKQKKLCLYCIAGAAINMASAVIISPVAKRGIKKLLRS